MKRVLAIVRKDARRLWPYSLILAILLALAGALDPVFTSRPASPYLDWLLPLACWTVVIGAIHEERLPGDRQYWLTRPLTWKQLLAAKILFVLLFVNLPLLLYHATVWMAAGIPPLQHVRVLLWSQMFFTAVCLMPAAVLAAITRNLGETILTALATGAGWLAALAALTWTRVVSAAWERTFYLALASAAGCGLVLVVQYSRRRTGLARGLVACTIVAVLLVEVRVPPGHAAAGGAGDSPVRILRDNARPLLYQVGRYGGSLAVPIRVEGVPAGADPFTDSVTAEISGPGVKLNAQLRPSLTRDALRVVLTSDYLAAVERGAIDVRGSAQITFFRRRQAIAAPQAGRTVVPGAGVCSTQHWLAGYEIVCYTPVPRLALFAESGAGWANWIVPYGLASDHLGIVNVFRPLEKHTTQVSYPKLEDLSGVTLVTAEPVGRIRVPYDFEGLRFRRAAPGEWR